MNKTAVFKIEKRENWVLSWIRLLPAQFSLVLWIDSFMFLLKTECTTLLEDS